MKKNKAKIISIIIITVSIISISLNAYTHSGRTDSNGGHKDNKNKSGLGSYHYHCGGHPAHLHKNGVCPYASGSSSSQSSSSSSSSSQSSSSSSSSSQSSSSGSSSSQSSSSGASSSQSSSSGSSSSQSSSSSSSSSQSSSSSSSSSQSDTSNASTTTKPATVAVTEIQINENPETLEVGASKMLTVTITPNNATNKEITWKTSDESVATISTTGEVMAKKAGTVDIIASTTNGKNSTIRIQIQEPPKEEAVEQENKKEENTFLQTSVQTLSNSTSEEQTESSPLAGVLALGLCGGGGYFLYSKHKKKNKKINKNSTQL